MAPTCETESPPCCWQWRGIVRGRRRHDFSTGSAPPDLSRAEVRRLSACWSTARARDEVEQLIRRRHACAVAALARAPIPEHVRAALEDLAAQVVEGVGLIRVVVLGAGIGSLSAACHLVGDGHDVDVLERGDARGGSAGVLRSAGYQFDTGPTVLTMPALLEEALNAAGCELSDLLSLAPLDPIYRADLRDGAVLSVRSGREPMSEELAAPSARERPPPSRGLPIGLPSSTSWSWARLSTGTSTPRSILFARSRPCCA